MNKSISTVLLIILGGGLLKLLAFGLSENQMPRYTQVMIIGLGLLVLATLLYYSKIRQAFGQSGDETDSRYANAPIGIGTLRKVRRTHLSINDIPQYELTFDVQTPDGQQFAARAHLLAMSHELARFTEGSRIPVCYLPGRLNRVQLAPESRAAEAAEVAHAIGVRQGTADPEVMEIARSGRTSIGVVLSTEPTGEIRGGQTALALTVRIQRPEGTYFDATKTVYVTPAMLASVQVGRQVEVRYLPYDESRFCLTLAL